MPAPYRSTTPGRAVGFSFIPVFNLYWVFRAIPGLSASIARARRAVDPAARGGAGFGIGVAACVVGLVPYLGGLAFLLFLPWLLVANGARNDLLRRLGASR